MIIQIINFLLVTQLPIASSGKGNLLQYVRHHVLVSMSSQYSSFRPEYAIDGNTTSLHPDICKCCAATNSGPSWFRLDLGKQYMINSIEFIGRKDNRGYQSRNFKIFSGFSNSSETQILLYENKASKGYIFSKNFTSKVAVQHLEVTSTIVLAICELKLEINFMELNNAHASMSTEYTAFDHTFSAQYAIDGDESTLPDSCYCCAKTSTAPSKWWLDLGRQYLVQGLVIIGRSDGHSYQSRNFKVYDGFFNSTMGQDLLYANQESDGYMFIHYLRVPIVLQYLEISSSSILTICELNLVPGECESGHFGQNCSSLCHCLLYQSCDLISGRCLSGMCAPGWKGENCSLACDIGSFGQNCSSRCHCLLGHPCDHINGSCPSGLCAQGWKRDNCSLACESGSFGQNCSSICHCLLDQSCDHIDGSCPSDLCVPGWQGENCSLACRMGTFGQNCSSTCHCLWDQSCDHIVGSCLSGLCAPGWKGENCSLACESPAFGVNCSSTCHCFSEGSCNHINGSCISGICAAGWHGENCSQECKSPTFGESCSSTCHCLFNESCDHINGSCISGICAAGWHADNCSLECRCLLNDSCEHITGSCPLGLCSPGWQGENCNQACENGTFGQNCSSACHCQLEKSCNHINGSCLSGTCKRGWSGENCSLGVDLKIVDKRDQSVYGPVAGSVSGIVVLSVVVALIIYRRRISLQRGTGTKANILSRNSADTTEMHIYQNILVSNDKSASFDNDTSVYQEIPEARSAKSGIPIKQISCYFTPLRKTKLQRLEEEFKLLQDNHNGEGPTFNKKYTQKQISGEARRVHLTDSTGKKFSQIEAYFIDGYNMKKRFIVDRGTTKDAVTFWEMIYQENTPMIVMMQDSQRKKKTPFLPNRAPEEKAVFGAITIMTENYTTFYNHAVRNFIISKENNHQKRVTQIQFNGSFVEDVPNSCSDFVQFWRKSISLIANAKGPIVVHCSKGISRAGIFIALDNLFTQALTTGYINPQAIVKQMNNQLKNIIESKDQYVFVFESVEEALHVRMDDIKMHEFDGLFKSLIQQEDTTGNPGLAFQYNLLFDIDEKYVNLQKRQRGHEYTILSHTTRNADDQAAKTPSQPIPQRSFSDGQISSVTLQNFAEKNTFILLYAYDRNLGENLLVMIENKNIKTVITYGIDYEENIRLESSICQVTGDFSVQKIESTQGNGFSVYTYSFKRKDLITAGVKSIKHFHYVGDKSDENFLGGVRAFAGFVCAIQQWQMLSNENDPILLICRAHMKIMGIVYVLLNEYDRIRCRAEVNIPRSVQKLKEENERLVPSYEQYEFCHLAVLECIKTL